MHAFSRAGLAAAALLLLLSLFVSSTSAAPVPMPVLAHGRALSVQRAPASASAHALPVPPAGHALVHQANYAAQAVLTADNGAAARVVAEDAPVLVRRKSLGERMHELHMKVKAVGQKIKAGFQKFGQKVKEGFKKFGQKVKVGFQKFGHFLKTTGAKIVKVGLKIWSTVVKVASKVVGWIPGIGKPIAKAMGGVATAASKVSDAIHVKIGGKLGKAMNGMNKAQKVLGYIPREVPDGLQERDFDVREGGEVVEFDGRDFEHWIYERAWDDWEDDFYM